MGHHFESELARTHPQLDLSDLYAFPADRPGFTAFVMCQNPQSKPGAGNLMDAGLYSFHIGFDRDASRGLTMTFRRDGPNLRVGRVSSAIPQLGEAGEPAGVFAHGATLSSEDGTKVWVGTAKDPFAGNAIGLRSFKESAARGVFRPDAFDNAQNFFENQLTTAIVFELPNAALPDTIYYYGTSAWLDHGHWHQVNRIGHVLLPHLYLEAGTVTLTQMTSSVLTDGDRRQAVAKLVAKYAEMAGIQKDPRAYGARIAGTILPDVIPYKPGTQAAYSVERTNGRALDDPAMDVALHWLIGGPLSAKVAPKDRSSKHFPYVIAV